MRADTPLSLATALAGEGSLALTREPARTLVEGLQAGVAVLNTHRRFLRGNALGRARLADDPGAACHKVLHDQDVPCAACPRGSGRPVVSDHGACVPLVAGGEIGGIVCVFESGQATLHGVNPADILTYASSAVFVVDRVFRICFANAAFERLHGKEGTTLVGQELASVIDAATFSRFCLTAKQVRESGKVREEELQLTINGRERFFWAACIPLGDGPAGNGLCGMLTDITAHKSAERELEESRRRYLAIVEDQVELVLRLGPDLRRVFVNQALARLLDRPVASLLGEVVGNGLLPPAETAALHRQLLQLTPHAPTCTIRLQVVLPKGEERALNWRVRAIFDDTGCLAEYQAMGRDVTAYWRMERELVKSEAKYRDFFEHSAEGLFQFDPGGRIVACNPALARILGYASTEAILGERGDLFGRIQSRQEDRLEFLRLLAQLGRVFDFEMQVVRRDGRTVWLSLNARAVLDASGRLAWVEGAARDITDRKRAEEERMLLVSAVDQSAEGLVIVSRDFRLEYANPAFAQIVGGGQGATGRTDLEARLEMFLSESVRKMLALGLRWSGRVRLSRPDGDEGVTEALISPVRDASGLIVNHIMLVRDMTYEMGLEKRLRQAEKLEAIGVLAGGVAHDFNNILTPILLNTEMILADIPWKHPLRKPLADVVRASERARDLVRQLLTFSRQGELTVGELSLPSLVKETIKLTRGMVDPRVEIHQRVSELHLVIEADPAQIHQVLANLCLNAAQAMPDGGVMEVGLSPVPEPPRPESGSIAAGLPLARLAPGPYARLWVSDTGHGMAPDICERIFEPFFTTKKPGQGTGMGLAAVHGIIKSYGGAVLVSSTPGRGSLFEVYLPLLPRRDVQDLS